MMNYTPCNIKYVDLDFIKKNYISFTFSPQKIIEMGVFF